VNVLLKLAARELRGGVRGLRVVLACLALGVTSIAAVGSLRAAINEGLATDGRRILGGDLEVQSGSQPLPDALRAWLRERDAKLSETVQMRSMLIAGSGERTLVELKAVDAAWPMVGQADFSPAQSVAAALGEADGHFGLAAEQVVLDRLGLKPGDLVRLGSAQFVVRGALTTEPDGVASPSLLGPRVLISSAALPETGLVQPGALLENHLRILLPVGVNVAAVAKELRAAFANQGWRLRDAHDAVPGLVSFIDQTSLFMTLVGLTSLLVGGIGVANGVRAWLDARARSIAILRCLGASARLVFWLCLLQVMALSVVGIVIGLAAGAVLPIVGLSVFKNLLPVPPHIGVFSGPLLLAGAYGLLTAAAFSLWPLARAMRIPGAALFRDALIPERQRPGVGLMAGNLVLGLALVGLTVATAEERGFALWFCLAAAATLLLFRGGGDLLVRVVRALPPPRAAWARLGLGNLVRPGNATPLMLVSLGLGLSTLACVALIEGNVRQQILDQLPRNAPSFYFIDIQDDQLGKFEALLAGQPGVSDFKQMPNLRARVVALNGVPADQVHVAADTAWALRGDRGLTYAASPPEGTQLVAGAWWPENYAGPPEVSFDDGLARGWGIKVGDTITVNVLGRDIVLRVASLRRIAWRSLSMNYAMVASPGLLAHAPHTHIATVRVSEAQQGPLLRLVTDALPNVTGIRVEDILKNLANFLGQIGTALAATGSLTLAAGALVLASAVAAGQRRRTREAVILKSLGATRRQIRAAWLVEFGVLGLAAGLIASVVGSAASFAVMHYVMGGEWVLLPGTLAVTISSCVGMMLAFGYAGTSIALRAKVAPLLRNE
jgi:putative ABC transport system permease protein